MPARFPCSPVTETQSRLAWAAQAQHLSRTQGSEKATARVGLSMSSSIPTTGTKSPSLFCHLGVALPPDGQIGLTCPTPSALASLPAAGAPKPMSFLSLGAKEEEAFPSPKPCIGTQSLPTWEAQRQTKRSARHECATHRFTYFLASLFTNLKAKKPLEMKKHKAKEGCRKRLVMYSLHPLDSLVQESRIHCPCPHGLQQPTAIRL